MKLRNLLIFAFAWAFSVSALAQDSNLTTLTASLRQNTSDPALRERIIKLALETKPAPAIPREAKELEGAGKYFANSAASEADFTKAAAEFENAALVAPWVAGFYYNAAVMYEKAKQPAKALWNYEFYLLAAPNASDADAVIEKIGGMKAAAKVAADQRSAEEESRRQYAAAAERESQRTAGIRTVNSYVSGKDYRMLLCRAYEGCNEKEFHGKNWTTQPGFSGPQPVYRWELRPEAIYLKWGALSGSEQYLLRGVPNGPSTSDIIWELPDMRNYQSGESLSWNRRWVRNTGFMQISPDFSQIIIGWRAPQPKERTQLYMYTSR